MSRQVMQQALEALELAHQQAESEMVMTLDELRLKVRPAVAALRAALAEPVPEPVALRPVANVEQMDDCGYVRVKSSAVDWLKKHYPALCEKSGMCERVGGMLFVKTRLEATHPPKAGNQEKT